MYIYKGGLALNNPQCLICQQTKLVEQQWYDLTHSWEDNGWLGFIAYQPL